jgi:hypothetical protein
MISQNSQCEELILELFSNVFHDLSIRYPEDKKSLARDFHTLQKRVSCEGVSFCTKILPKLGKAFERALETGRIEVPREFKRSHGNQTIPAFMQAMFMRCFGPCGSLGEPSPGVIRDIRQVLFFVYKLELPYLRVQEQAVLTAFLDTENELRCGDEPMDGPVFQGARELVTEVCGGFDASAILPRHGPGAVATGERQDEKWTFKRLYPSLHRLYPYYEYFMVGGARELIDRIKWYRGLVRDEIPTAKVVLVPKDSRGPRLISCEPLEIQYIQQGIMKSLVPHIEKHRLTRERVNFTFQDFNRNLATISSIDRSRATIDLKDASDRVSLRLVEQLFADTALLDALRATRSPQTRMPDGTIVELCKYAPMGSALCFPIEALCFWAIASSAISLSFNVPLHESGRLVYVYGDDIIIPRNAYECVIGALESASLRVNRTKCFVDGYFRESCGMDAYKGHDVTPLKIRTLWTGKPSDGSAFASYVTYANRLGELGYGQTAAFLWAMIERVYGRVPYGTSESGYPSRWVSSKFKALIKNIEEGFRVRWKDSVQVVEILAKRITTHLDETSLDGWNRLLRDQVSPMLDTPNQVVNPRRTQIRTRWIAVV